MAKIQQLPEAVYARIAAGEVIVSPAAAVKELIENSIDAGASGITIEIVDGGKELIRVTDNGSGISSQDLPLAAARHATSKIAVFEDVYNLGTLGFRGEALSSMAEVSRFSISTREKGAELGARLSISGGGDPVIEPVGVPEGTTVRVEDLFYNVPARRRFLKTGGREGAQVSETVRRAILSSPHIAFKFIRNGKTVYQSPGNGNLMTATASVYGLASTRELLDLKREDDNCAMYGCISRPTYAFKTTQRIDFFVNGRYIRSKSLQKALMRGYGESMLHAHYPCAVLNIIIDPNMIDVNVHPAKLRAVFYDEERIENAVSDAVRCVVGTANGAPYIPRSSERENEKCSGEGRAMDHNKSAPDPNLTSTTRRSQPVHIAQMAEAQTSKSTTEQYALEAACSDRRYAGDSMSEKNQTDDSSRIVDAGAFSDFIRTTSEPHLGEHEDLIDVRTVRDTRILGSVFATYVIVECDDRLFFIDQHAARERITYERMLQWTRRGEKYAQTLLIPVVRTFRAPEFNALMENADMLERVGLHFEEFGELTLRFFSFPLEIGTSDIDSFIGDIIAELQEHPDDPIIARDRLIASACRHSVKSGTQLTEHEMKTLVSEIAEMDAIPFCPHGRPIAVEITRDQLEKGFKRRV